MVPCQSLSEIHDDQSHQSACDHDQAHRPGSLPCHGRTESVGFGEKPC